MRYIDLFSGIGGFALGLRQAGIEFEEHWFSEIDKNAISIYKKHFPNAKELGDVRTIRDFSGLKADIITFGFPCQDLSVAGKRRGLAGDRSGLFFEAMRIIRELKPQYFIFENVKGLLTNNGGADFVRCLQEIADIGLYECEWQLVNTSWVLPQNRERVYFVGRLGGRAGAKIFPLERKDIKVVKIDVWNIGKLVEDNPVWEQEEQEIIEEIKDDISIISRKGELKKSQNIASCLTVGGHGCGNHSDMDLICIRQINRSEKNRQQDRVYSPEGLCPALNTVGGGNLEPKIICPVLTPERLEKRQNGRRMKENGEPSFTLTAQDRHGIYDGARIRKLTPVECERLQGFPDGWTECGADGKKMSDSARYRALGNAVTVDFPRMIGEKLR